MRRNRISESIRLAGYHGVVSLIILSGVLLFLGGIVFVLCGTQWSLKESPLSWLGPLPALLGAIEIGIGIGLLQYKKWSYTAWIAVTSLNSLIWMCGTWWVLHFRPTMGPLTRALFENLEFSYGALAFLSIMSLLYLILPQTRRLFLKMRRDQRWGETGSGLEL